MQRLNARPLNNKAGAVQYPLGQQGSSGWWYKIEWNYRENVGSWKIRKLLQKYFQPIVSYMSRKTCHEAGWDWFSSEPTFFNFFFLPILPTFFCRNLFRFSKGNPESDFSCEILLLRPTKRNIIDFVQKKVAKKVEIAKDTFWSLLFQLCNKSTKTPFAQDNLIYIAAGKSPLKWILGWY